LVERLMREPSLRDWPGLGLAVQAYLLRAGGVLGHLLEASRAARRPLAIRLVKGAYWDGEIKRAQELGIPAFPVFTRKWGSDLSYLALAHRLLTSDAPVFAQFGTHNALTVASILEMASSLPARPFEFQRLHGMGGPLYAAVMEQHPQAHVRVYAPVGPFNDLLAYLVRRLLENGANSSFVHQIAAPHLPVEAFLTDPRAQARRDDQPLPALRAGTALFPDRANARGRDLQDPPTLLALAGAVHSPHGAWRAGPLLAVAINGTPGPRAIRNPARLDEVVGELRDADPADAEAAIGAATAAFSPWNARPVEERAAILLAAADGLEAAHDEFVGLLVREAGKTLCWVAH
jgi:RHH-type transcriptional regulator, proline utilization regulon repressor / proline dehydrogenase / delta 1-pyrroline-5-carboxylate dehydrogenase